MDYVNDININEGVISVLDTNAAEPILNEFKLDLDEETYKFLYKHIEKCLKDEDLKYAKFKQDRNVVKDIVKNYLNGTEDDLIKISKELSRQLFSHIMQNVNISSCDLIVASIVTDQGPMIAILKMDYVKNFTHEVDFIENKLGINIVPQMAGLPRSSQRIQKAAFIMPVREGNSYNLMILDKQKRSKADEDYGANYWIDSFLGCYAITNERDNTKNLLKTTENFVRRYYSDNAEKAEEIRTTVKTKLKEEETININEMSEELFNEAPEVKQTFKTMILSNCEEEFQVDQSYIAKKLKRTRLKIDKDIDLYIDDEAYKDKSKFEIIRNGDGSINLVIKHVINYIEK